MIRCHLESDRHNHKDESEKVVCAGVPPVAGGGEGAGQARV
jgi:hypothetical protein